MSEVDTEKLYLVNKYRATREMLEKGEIVIKDMKSIDYQLYMLGQRYYYESHPEERK